MLATQQRLDDAGGYPVLISEAEAENNMDLRNNGTEREAKSCRRSCGHGEVCIKYNGVGIPVDMNTSSCGFWP